MKSTIITAACAIAIACMSLPAMANDTPTRAGAGDRIKGLANQAAGSVKRGVGNVTDSKRLQAEGSAQKLKGKAQYQKGRAKDVINNATGM